MSALQIQHQDLGQGQQLAVLSLNSPKTLNALSLDLVDALQQALDRSAEDPAVVAVWLDATSEKAFCAGGDLQQLYASMQEYGDQPNPYAQQFFGREYRLDYTVHTYPKPLVVWMHGIVMGGGIGLACGGAHRIVTQESMLAMPEIGIGLFPDVGGSWFLGRMPGGIGRYLALTGARMNAADAIFAGLADLHIPQAQKETVMRGLAGVEWTADAQLNQVLLRRYLHTQSADPGASALTEHFAPLARIASLPTPQEAMSAILSWAEMESWAAPHAKALQRGAPSSAALGWYLQQRTQRADLATVLRTEFAAALGCCALGDFAEGIRALIIDKDKNPTWAAATWEQVGPELIERWLQPRWEGAHPLADLGRPH